MCNQAIMITCMQGECAIEVRLGGAQSKVHKNVYRGSRVGILRQAELTPHVIKNGVDKLRDRRRFEAMYLTPETPKFSCMR